jgi:hypothetical protein
LYFDIPLPIHKTLLLVDGTRFLNMRRNHIFLFLLLIILQSAPYLAAQFQWGPDWVFGGFLLNPIDGNTYLSKLQEGWAGSWRFSLLYSPEIGKGASVFLFYLFLGHIARWFGLPLIIVFHAARLVGIVALFGAVRRLCRVVFQGDERLADFGLWLMLLGSGMGWLVALSGGAMTGDFWVSEAYPFLSMFANPHFPIGLAIMLELIVLDLTSSALWKWPVAAVLGLLLSVIQPFGVVILGGVLAGRVIWQWFMHRRFEPFFIVSALSLGGLYMLYQLWALRNDPLLAQWDAQNLTLSLPWWDLTLSMLPALLFSLLGAWVYWKRSDGYVFLLIFWLAFSLILVNMPLNLQRRFMTGMYVPAVLLAVMGAGWIAARFRRIGRWVMPVLLGLSLLTNILILISSFFAPRILVNGRPDPQIFLSRAEVAAMGWLKSHASADAVVLASPEMGLYIPAWTGRHVVFGHPYESIHAAERKNEVTEYFDAKMNSEQTEQMFRTYDIDFVFVEKAQVNGNLSGVAANNLVFEQDGVEIYQVVP